MFAPGCAEEAGSEPSWVYGDLTLRLEYENGDPVRYAELMTRDLENPSETEDTASVCYTNNDGVEFIQNVAAPNSATFYSVDAEGTTSKFTLDITEDSYGERVEITVQEIAIE